ncbi:MAG: hypothetical protein ACC657_09550 [Thiohalomonadales bacterium]
MKILDNISYPVIIVIAIFLSVAPLSGEPHLIEKLRMLSSLTLSRPIDIFDLVLHSAPVIILILKVIRTIFINNKLTE